MATSVEVAAAVAAVGDVAEGGAGAGARTEQDRLDHAGVETGGQGLLSCTAVADGRVRETV